MSLSVFEAIVSKVEQLSQIVGHFYCVASKNAFHAQITVHCGGREETKGLCISLNYLLRPLLGDHNFEVINPTGTTGESIFLLIDIG